MLAKTDKQKSCKDRSESFDHHDDGDGDDSHGDDDDDDDNDDDSDDDDARLMTKPPS